MLNFFRRNFPRIIITKWQRLQATTNFFEVESIYWSASEESELEQKAFEKMVELASSYNHWKKIHEKMVHRFADDKDRVDTLTKMSTYACYFFQWADIYKRSSKGSELEQKAFEQMLATANDQDHWFKLLNLVPKGSDAEKKAHEMILSLKETPK